MAWFKVLHHKSKGLRKTTNNISDKLCDVQDLNRNSSVDTSEGLESNGLLWQSHWHSDDSFYSWLKRDQLDVTCFIISLFIAQHVSDVNTSILRSLRCTGWERTAVLSQPVHRMAAYRCDDTRGRVKQVWPPDDEHMCSKHVEAWNKLIVKQKFCASSWLITEIKRNYNL